MAEKTGKAKEALGWLTADREVEAEGRVEREADGEPSEEDVEAKAEEVREQYGETSDGSENPDPAH
jgi:uncharacterized protein YjbJ (UPF0337 family)